MSSPAQAWKFGGRLAKELRRPFKNRVMIINSALIEGKQHLFNMKTIARKSTWAQLQRTPLASLPCQQDREGPPVMEYDKSHWYTDLNSEQSYQQQQ